MTLLFTSFCTWLPHQISNTSDDILSIVEQTNKDNCYYLRQLPVNIEVASQKAIAAIQKIQPSVIICCGMAESRNCLTIESNARLDRNCLYTTVNLSQLTKYLSHTSISDDAGQFVCEGLYYQVLKYLQLNQLKTSCIFVHVPLLTIDNTEKILQDFSKIISFFQK